MSASTAPRAIVGPTGLTLWRLTPTLSIMWPGPGSRLLIGQCELPGGAVTHIDHATARDAYPTRKDADSAVRAFVAAAAE